MRPRRADPHTLAGPYALGALPPREQARFERHLAACESCADEVRGLRETTARLAAATARPPSAQLRDRVLAEVSRTRQLPPEPVTVGTTWRWRSRLRWAGLTGRWLRAGRRPWLRPVAVTLAAACLAAVAVSASVAVTASRQLNQEQARDHLLAAVLTAPDATMMSAPVHGGGTATVVMSHQMRALAFSSAGLPAPPAGDAYELWLMGPDGDHSVGMLHPAHGMTMPVIATGLRSGDRVELTVEPAAGAGQPTTRPLLLLAL